MNDIAKDMGVSKKTLYQYVKDKSDLVQSLIQMELDRKRENYDRIHNQGLSPVEELHEVSHQLRKDLNETNPSMMFDLEKYYPEAWKLWLDFKNDFIKGCIRENLIKGIEEGVFRAEIDADIMSVFRVEQIELAFNEAIFPKENFHFIKVQMAIFEHFVHGILTPKGKEQFNNCCK